MKGLSIKHGAVYVQCLLVLLLFMGVVEILEAEEMPTFVRILFIAGLGVLFVPAVLVVRELLARSSGRGENDIL